MTYSKGKMEGKCDKASPHFRPSVAGNISNTCLSTFYYRCHL